MSFPGHGIGQEQNSGSIRLSVSKQGITTKRPRFSMLALMRVTLSRDRLRKGDLITHELITPGRSKLLGGVESETFGGLARLLPRRLLRPYPSMSQPQPQSKPHPWLELARSLTPHPSPLAPSSLPFLLALAQGHERGRT